jgi:hypothetical protein
LTGIVNDEDKVYFLQHCDFALNLLEGGAGINVKMFEYFAFGIPIITTVHGARGIDIITGKDGILTGNINFLADVRAFCDSSIEERDAIAINALELLREKYSWRSLGRNIIEVIEKQYSLSLLDKVLPLDEIALYNFNEGEPYLPIKPFYIRCAGDWGMKCHEFLNKKGLTPIAFIDEGKQGNFIDGIPIISMKQYLAEQCDSEVIVAVYKLVEFAADLVVLGIPLNDISLSWDGRQIVSMADLNGSYPYYIDANKWRNGIHEKIFAGEYS